ncbi:MAG: right-handed parallel beta-helix repeat-containing protein [Vallitalea sp.]|jgi:hypothetical protein|nr:right-handed parallel beta-helix repeat-containing protein [Vallitalea sp.]
MKHLSKSKARISLIGVLVLVLSLMSGMGNCTIVKGASGNTYYVSQQNGDDSRTLIEAKNVNTPWKTISKAASIMQAGDQCIIMEGVYRETVVPSNSGTELHPITFKAATGANVEIRGTDIATNTWQQHANNIYVMDISNNPMNLGTSNQVFTNTGLMVEARWPNVNTTNNDFLLNPTLATADRGSSTKKIVDASLPAIDWTGGRVWYIGKKLGAWSAFSAVIETSQNNTITFTPQLHELWTKCAPKQGGEYFISGVYDALDNDGEWYYDNNTKKLYVYSQSGIPAQNSIEYKKRLFGFDLSGLSYVNIEGINIFGCTITSDDLSSHITIDGIIAKYISHNSEAVGNHFSQVYNSGIMLQGDYNTIKNSEIAYSSGNGVLLSGNHGKIINNYIHDTNYSAIYCAAIRPLGDHHLVSYNTITKTGRGALYTNSVSKMIIEYNDISSTMLQSADGGAIYLGWLHGDNSEIRYNKFYNTTAKNSSSIYLDNSAFGYIIHHNIVYNNVAPGGINAMQLNGPKEFCLVYNNTLYNNGSIGNYFSYKNHSDWLGSQFVNNIAEKGIKASSKVAEVFMSNNYTTNSPTPGFVNSASGNFLLTQNSPNVDAGMEIPGITDGYVSSAPDVGALERGGEDWTVNVGHDFGKDRDSVYKEVDTLYKGLTRNPSFEEGTLNKGIKYQDIVAGQTPDTILIDGNIPNWTRTGTNDSKILFETTQRSFTKADKYTNTGWHCLKLGNGVNGIEQTITGLTPNTKYRVSGWFRVENGASVTMGVKGYTGSSVTKTQASTNGVWRRQKLEFSTGATDTSVTVYVDKTTAGTQYVLIDDISMQYVGNVQPAIIGTWNPVDGGFNQTNASIEAIYTLDGDKEDVSYEATVRITGGENKIGILGRYQDFNHFYVLNMNPNELSLWKKVDVDSYIKLGSAAITATLNTDYQLKLVLEGDSIKGYLDGNLKIDATDSAYSSGKVGARTYNSTGLWLNPIVDENVGYPVTDNFDNGLANWESVSGHWAIVDGEYLQSNASIDAISVAGKEGWTNNSMEADVTITGGENKVGLISRYKDVNNYYLMNVNTTEVSIWKIVKGMSYKLNSYVFSSNGEADLTRGQVYRLKLVTNGNSLKAYIDNSLKLEADTGSSINSGKMGLRTYNTSAKFDNVLISN